MGCVDLGDESLLPGYGSAELPTARESAMVAKNFIATMIGVKNREGGASPAAEE